MSQTGFMLFKAMGDPARPHPDFCPGQNQDDTVDSDAAGFAMTYSVFQSHWGASKEARDDLKSQQDSVAKGELEDCDDIAYVRPVEVEDDGSLVILKEDFSGEICRYSKEEVYDFFGMTPPTADVENIASP